MSYGRKVGLQFDVRIVLMNSAETLDRPFAIEDMPPIIQGGMGVRASSAYLAGAVASEGGVGIVSGTLMGLVLARNLQRGDEDFKRIIETEFPDEEIKDRILSRYFVEGGIPEGQSYENVPMLGHRPIEMAEDLNLVGVFAEVRLAKERAGGKGVIGVNLLTKLQEPTPSGLHGAMLAGAGVVIMGAGLPKHIPGMLDDIAMRRPTKNLLTVKGAPDGTFSMTYDAENRYPGLKDVELTRPSFLAIVSTKMAARVAVDKSSPPDGFIVERPSAGGHNAPPREKDNFNSRGEPIYTDRDEVDQEYLNDAGLPYWMAGGHADPEVLKRAVEQGANGVQVGSAFALAEESGLVDKQRIVNAIMGGEDLDVYTDPLASPTGYPFKVVSLGGTLSESDVYAARTRVCDIGVLREMYRKDDGTIGYRCPSEPEANFMRKGGELPATIGRKCLCNGLVAEIGLGQVTPDGSVERSIITGADRINENARDVMAHAGRSPNADGSWSLYTASDVMNYMRS